MVVSGQNSKSRKLENARSIVAWAGIMHGITSTNILLVKAITKPSGHKGGGHKLHFLTRKKFTFVLQRSRSESLGLSFKTIVYTIFLYHMSEKVRLVFSLFKQQGFLLELLCYRHPHSLLSLSASNMAARRMTTSTYPKLTQHWVLGTD